MKKRTHKKLSLEKLVVSKISYTNTIRGGIISRKSLEIPCDLTTRPRESVGGNNCASQDNCDMSFE